MTNVRDPATLSFLEARLIAEIADTEKKIRELNQEKATLERMLLKARQQNELLKRSDVTRKSSINRVLIENSVLQSLKGAKDPQRARYLYNDARLIISNLRESTFRSILHRMKSRGLIISGGAGTWLIGPNQS